MTLSDLSHFFSRRRMPRFSTQTLFLVLAIVMTVIVATGIIYASFLLVSKVNVATSVEPAAPQTAQFDLQSFEKLKIAP